MKKSRMAAGLPESNPLTSTTPVSTGIGNNCAAQTGVSEDAVLPCASEDALSVASEDTAHPLVPSQDANPMPPVKEQSDTASSGQARKIDSVYVATYGDITEEIIHGFAPTSLNFLFARNWGSYPLKDGRYVYEENFREGKKIHILKKAYSGLSSEILEFLTETDRKDTNGQRKDRDHAAFNAGSDQSHEDPETGYFHQSTMDRAAFQKWQMEENRKAAVPDPVYPDGVLKKHFVPGESRANNQRWQMRRQVIEQYIPNLSRKDQETVNKYYGMGMTMKQIGAEDGVDKTAVGNRLSRIKPEAREIFDRLGIEVPSDEQLKAEKAAAAERRKELKEAERLRREEERDVRMIHAVATGASDLDDYIETGRVKIKPKKAERDLGDYDPDNAYDSLYDDDYDPYEDPRYKEAEAEEAAIWEDEEAGTTSEEAETTPADDDKPREDRDGWTGCDGRYADIDRQDDEDGYEYDELYEDPDDEEDDG